MKSLVFVSCLTVLSLASASAQETPKFNFDLGAGFTSTVGNTARQLDTGWNIGAGAAFNFSPVVGAKLNVSYSDMGINNSTLRTLGYPGGGVHIFSATVDPVVHLTPHHRADVYLSAGGGLFHLYQNFTQPAVAVTTVYNPFFGIYPVAFGTNQVLASYSVNKPGFDVGGGVAFGGVGHGKFFAEAKWDHMFLTNSHVDYVPVSFGFRW